MSYFQSSQGCSTSGSSACSYSCTCANCDAARRRGVGPAASTATALRQPNIDGGLAPNHCSEPDRIAPAPGVGQDVDDYIEPAELLALVERLPKERRTAGPVDCLHLLLKVIGDESGSEDLADICGELAAQGKRWRGYPQLLIGCEVLAFADGTYEVLWGFDDEDSVPEQIPGTLGDVLDACESDIIPAWFPLDWIQVLDSDDVWRPRCMTMSRLDAVGGGTVPHPGPVRLH